MSLTQNGTKNKRDFPTYKIQQLFNLHRKHTLVVALNVPQAKIVKGIETLVFN